MIDKKRKIMFIIMGAIVLISVIATLYTNYKEKTRNTNTTNKTNVISTTNTTNQNMEVEKEIKVENETFVNNEAKIDVSDINEEAKQKIETYLNNYYERVWDELDDEYSDDGIREMLSQEHNGSFGEVGFNQSFERVYKNDKVVSYSYSLVGNLRGTAWEEVDGISFDVNTGDPIKIEDILTSKDQYIAVCKQYVHECLKQDKRNSMLYENYESVVDQHIESLEGFIYDGGIVCVIIQKYEIASGAAGQFEYMIPYDLVKDYIKSEYVFE